MKKILTVSALSALLVSFGFTQSFSVQEDFAYVDGHFAVSCNNQNLAHVATGKVFGSRTKASFDSKYVDATAEVIVCNNSYFNANLKADFNYDLTDNLTVLATGDYSCFLFKDSVNYQVCRAYGGLQLNESWKFFDLSLSGFVGYDIVDRATIKRYSLDLDGSLYIGFRMDLGITEYFNFFAGIDSYQVPDLFPYWNPKSINNYIGVEANYSFTDHISVVASCSHFCRHPEAAWKSCKDVNCLNASGNLVTLGCKVNF